MLICFCFLPKKYLTILYHIYGYITIQNDLLKIVVEILNEICLFDVLMFICVMFMCPCLVD